MCGILCDDCAKDRERRLQLESEIKSLIQQLDRDMPIHEFIVLKNQIRYLIDEIY